MQSGNAVDVKPIVLWILRTGGEVGMNEDRKLVEFIESYIKIGNGDYKWNDNHGELIRCKDCKHYKPYTGRVSGNMFHECEFFDMDIEDPDWFCANGEKADDKGINL